MHEKIEIAFKDFPYALRNRMTDLAALNRDDRDTKIEFDEGPHIYTFTEHPETKITSVTTLVHAWVEPFDAEAILDRIFSANPIKEKYKGHTRETLKAQWKEAGISGSRLGTELHQNIEDYYNGKHVENQSVEWQHFMKFDAATTTMFKPYRTEWIVYDVPLQLAGSIDMVFENDDGSLSIYDWKRVRSIDKTSGFNKFLRHPDLQDIPDTNFWHYSFQLNIYKYLLEKNYGKTVTSLCLVQLHPDKKSYELFPCPNLQDRVHKVMQRRSLELS